MPDTYGQHSQFNQSKATRDKFCQEKDKMLAPILIPFISSKEPITCTALFMPALYGIELFFCSAHNIPMKNIFAIEENPDIHTELVRCSRPDRQMFKGIATSPVPMPLSRGLHHAGAAFPDGFDLIYLDFFGYPSAKHLESLRTIFQCKLLRRGGLLALNFARNRTHKHIKEFNDKVILEFRKLANNKQLDYNNLATGIFFCEALNFAKHPLPQNLWFSSYHSYHGNVDHQYTTMFAQF